MSEQGEQGERDGSGSGDAGRSTDAAPGGPGGPGGDGPGGPGGPADPAVPGAGGSGSHRFHTQIRIAVGILGPVLLTTAYFTVPFEVIGPEHPVLAWVIIVGLLTLLAIGMVMTTNRALVQQAGRFQHPGLAVLLMSWTAILVFAAGYWALATRHGQFVGLQTRLDALYFTGVTMSTVGYGDIHPSGQVGRAVVLVQLVYTFAFLVGGITAIRTQTRARLVERMKGGK